MDDHDSTTVDAASLSHLSSQLQSLGFITRPLDVASLFTAAPTPSTSGGGKDKDKNHDPTSILAHQASVQQQYRAREQVLRCLWSLLTARNDAAQGLEAVAARERVLAYELERTKAMLKKERQARESSERDKQNEKAKAQSATAAFATEQTRHRHAREELAKARLALQCVKTQAQLDQKRRDAEVSTMMARLQRLTADPAQTKFIIANAKLANVNSAAPPMAGGQGGASGRTTSARSAHLLSPRVDDRSSEEVVYWQSALEDCESERSRLALENEKLRELVGEVGEWAELMLSMDTVNNKEAREIGEGFAADTSLSIPSPHLAVTVAELATPIHNKLYQIRCGVSALVSGVEDRLEAVRNKLAAQLDMEHEELQEAKKAQVEVENELASAREAIAQSDKLMQDFATGQLLNAAIPVVELKDVEEEIAPIAVSPPRRTVVAHADPAPRPSIATADRVEAQRAKDVAAFLSDLGLDSPAPTARPLESLAAKVARLQRAPFGNTQLSTTTTITTTISGSDRLQKVLERTRVEMNQNGQRKENTKTASRPPTQF